MAENLGERLILLSKYFGKKGQTNLKFPFRSSEISKDTIKYGNSQPHESQKTCARAKSWMLDSKIATSQHSLSSCQKKL